jgi:hypothetical protein
MLREGWDVRNATTVVPLRPLSSKANILPEQASAPNSTTGSPTRCEPERKVLAFIAAHPLEQLYVSAVTFAEIRFGIELVADASKRAELNDWLAHKVRPMASRLI